LKVSFALGSIAHESVLRSEGLRPSSVKFAHGAEAQMPSGRMLVSSYHCSRYNTQTNRLTADMFETVLARAAALARA
jgi:uracil-DNA glycosylase